MIPSTNRVHPPFVHRDARLSCDGVSIESIVDRVGTPAYVYSAQAIRDAYRAIDEAFASHPHSIHYALKANSTLGLLRIIQGLGSCADANSVGELQVALRAGFKPRDLVFTGVGKTREELAFAVAIDVGAINVESPGELDRIAALAEARGTVARVAVRVNPDIDAGSHPNISTGLKTNKFGVALSDARQIYRDRREVRSLRFVGVHVHIGSQITTLDPLVRAARTVADLAVALRDDGIHVEHVDLGGGLGIGYDGLGNPVSPADYAGAVLPVLKPVGLPIVLEPGRALVASAGALVSRVVDVKQYPDGRRFAVLDAGMTELMRPALYGAFHRIVPVVQRDGPLSRWDVVGPICESSDVLGRDRELSELQVDDLLAVLDTGAYGAVMASNYNRHFLAPEVLVDAGRAQVIRRRQTIDDVLALEN